MIEKIAIAKLYNLRISPKKLINILASIKGKSYQNALILLKNKPKKANFIIWKLLHSVMSNFLYKFKFFNENILIKEAFVNTGSILKRIRERAKGKAFKIEKKKSHITIIIYENNI